MSEANNSNLISDSDTDYDSNSDTDINIETYIKDTNKNLQKVYQIQHLTDKTFKFEFMGLFETKPTVSLGDFKLNEDTHCYLSSNFITEEDINKTNFLPMVTLMISRKDKFMNMCMGIEFDKSSDDTSTINVNDTHTGSVFIAFIDENKNIGEILKKKLIYPGSSKLIYFLVGELKNEKVRKYILDN
jgi:hypothetical protein